jgi:hypothetical protein
MANIKNIRRPRKAAATKLLPSGVANSDLVPHDFERPPPKKHRGVGPSRPKPAARASDEEYQDASTRKRRRATAPAISTRRSTSVRIRPPSPSPELSDPEPKEPENGDRTVLPPEPSPPPPGIVQLMEHGKVVGWTRQKWFDEEQRMVETRVNGGVDAQVDGPARISEVLWIGDDGCVERRPISPEI